MKTEKPDPSAHTYAKKVVTIRKNGSRRVSQTFTIPTLTKQEFKDESDINKIVERAKRGIEPRLNPVQAQYGDVSNLPSFEEAFDIVQAAHETFMSLPARLRKLIDNDPRRMDELTLEDYRQHGLTKNTPVEAPPAPSAPRAEASEPPAGKPSKKAKTNFSELADDE